MFFEPTKRLVLTAGKTCVSQAVETWERTGVTCSVVVSSSSGLLSGLGRLTVSIEGSNDLENWDSFNQSWQVDVESSPSVTTFPDSYSNSIKTRYLRIRYHNDSTYNVLVSAKIYTVIN